MYQRIIERIEDGKQGFYCTIGRTETGIILLVTDEEPTKHTEVANARAVLQLDAEADSDVSRLQLRIWDDRTEKEGDPQDIITLIEDEPHNDENDDTTMGEP